MIEFSHTEDVPNAIEIHCCLLEMYGMNTMDVSNLSRWVRKAILSNKDEVSIHDASGNSCSIAETNDQHHVHVDDNIQGIRKTKLSEISSVLVISKENIQAKIADLNYRKFFMR